MRADAVAAALALLVLGCAGCRSSAVPDASVAGDAPPRCASDLAWMSGTWRAQDGDTLQEERWSAPLGGTLLGTGRLVVGGRTRFFEFLRIEERGGALVYVALPGGAGATEFTLAAGGADRARFENPGHDWPTALEYELGADGRLRATVSGPGRTEHYVWERSGP